MTIRDPLPHEPNCGLMWPAWYRYDGTWHNEIEAEQGLYDWPLTPDSRVIEVGAYEGAWAERIARQYGCTIQAFEPAARARQRAHARLRDISNVILLPYAVGGNDRQAILYGCNDDGASLWQRGGEQMTCTVVSMNHWFVFARIAEVDLLSLNCEGAEFEILEQMIVCNRLAQVKRLMIQWHAQDEHLGEAIERKASICAELAKTHRMLWNYGYVEAWERLER